MTEAYICDTIRTPIGRYGGALASVRTDDLAAIPLRALMGMTTFRVIQQDRAGHRQAPRRSRSRGCF